MLSGHVQVERALDDKASKYPEIKASGLPYVVALCAGSALVIGEEQIMSGVYGTIQVTISVAREPASDPVPPPFAVRRGGMLAQRRDGSFNNREISAVLYVWEDSTRTEQRLGRRSCITPSHSSRCLRPSSRMSLRRASSASARMTTA